MARHLSLALLLAMVTVNHASGQVVQLPTFQVFTVGTSVLIPDRGSAFLGGVDRAAYGSTTRGVPGMGGIPGLGRLFTNRGIGSEVSSSRAYASATIMDLGEMDRAVLAEAAAKRAASEAGLAGAAGASSRPLDPEVQRKAAFLSKHLAKTNRSNLPPPPPREAANSNFPPRSTP